MKIMNIKKKSLFLTPPLLAAVLLCMFVNAGQKKKKEAEVQEKIYIPEEVKAIITESLATRQPRLDIPFEISRLYYLPAQQNVHAVMIFTVKNTDLDFKPLLPKIEPATKNEAASSEPQKEDELKPAGSEILQADFKIFASVFERKNGKVEKIVRESYVPASFQEKTSAFQPEQEHRYSVGFPLPPGDFLLALVLASPDLTRLGLQFYEFSLPDAQSFRNKLDLTPVIFFESLKMLDQPEIITRVHKDMFVYSTLEIYPKKQNVFAPGEVMDILYFVYGCQPQKGTDQFNIQVNYQVKKEKKSILKFKEQTFQFPLISHPLPLLTEGDKPFASGRYELEISLKDTISGHSLNHTIDFEVK